MFITQLGRQPELSFAELAAVFGAAHVTQVAAEFATVDTKDFDLDQLGGTIKYGEIITTLPAAKNDAAALAAASKFITATYRKQWQSTSGKLTLGLSAHNLHVSPRAVQKIGLILKATLKPHGVNLRLIPNAEPALSTATSHNNRLGTSERKIELLIIRTNKGIVIAESRGVQNITADTHRDRHRPRRDAFVGMLPPKLAQIMLNLAVGTSAEASNRPAQSSEQSAARDSDAESRSEAVSDDFGGENGAVNGHGENASASTFTGTLDWQQFLDAAKTTSSGLYTLLNKCGHALTPDGLTLYAGTNFAKKKLDDAKFRPIISELIQQVAQTDLNITITSDKKPPEDEQLAEIAAMMGGGEEVKLDELETA